MIRKQPCPPHCPERKPACQGHCEAFEKYRAALESDKQLIREAKDNERVWTKARLDGKRKSEDFKQKLSKGFVHNR